MKRSMSAPLIPELLTMEGKAAVSQPATQNLLSRRVTSGSIVSLPGEIVIKTLPMDGSPRKQVRNLEDVEGREKGRGRLCKYLNSPFLVLDYLFVRRVIFKPQK